jgi:hypothetical protein
MNLTPYYLFGLALLACLMCYVIGHANGLNDYREALFNICQTGGLFSIPGYAGDYTCYNPTIWE